MDHAAIFIPFTIDDLELTLTLISDYLRLFDITDDELLIDRAQIEDLQEWLLEARMKYFEEEDDIDE